MAVMNEGICPLMTIAADPRCDGSRETECIRERCAWCGKALGSKPGGGTEGVTHGICAECMARMVEGFEEFAGEKED